MPLYQKNQNRFKSDPEALYLATKTVKSICQSLMSQYSYNQNIHVKMLNLQQQLHQVQHENLTIKKKNLKLKKKILHQKIIF